MGSLVQAAGGLVGGAIGFFVGGPTGALYGAQIGISVGGLLDPPKIKGPRLEDLAVQTSTYGAFIPRVYGTAPIVGNIFWVQGDKLIEQEKTTSGKGGPEVTSYSYFASFAIGLCEGPIAGIRRIWIGNQLWYDAGADDLDSVLASNRTAAGWVWYPGNEAQEADPLIQADKGMADTPAYRGIAYIVFEMLPLEKYGNSLLGTQVRCEVVTDSDTVPITEIYSRVIDDYIPNYVMPINPSLESDVLLAVMNGTSGSYDNYYYTLFRETTYPSTASIPYGNCCWSEGYADDTRFIYYSNDLSTFTFQGHGDAFNTGYSISYPGTDWVDSIHVGNIVWSFFTSKSSTYATFTVVYAPQAVLQDVVKVQPLTDKHFTYAYDADRSEVVIARSGSFERYDFETGAYIGSVSTSFVNYDSDTGSVSDGVFWQLHYITTFRYLRGYSLSSGTLLYSYTWGVPGSVAPCRGYVNNNLLFWVNEGTGSTHFFAIYRLPHGSLDGNTITLGDIVQAECLKSNLIEAADIDVSQLTDQVRGYRVGQSGPLRGSIDPLRKVWPFDVRQHGYQIEFVRRGGASVATIPAADLDARTAGQESGVSITDAREMDLMLPQKVGVKYLDYVREYDINEQSDERTSTDAVNQVSIDLPLSMVAEEAKAAATMLLYHGWLDRYDVAFVLPPTWQQLEPADPVTVEADNATYSLRLTSVNTLPDGRMECKAKYSDAAIYTQAQAVADEGGSPPRPISLSGPTVYELLDIPLMVDDQDTAGFPVAMGGVTSGWPAGLLYRSDDGGQSWSNPLSVVSPGATIGQAAGALAAYGSTVYDFASTLTVLLDQAYSLASVTEAQLFAGQNWFAYGAHGRWEIIAARTVTSLGSGEYRLQDFLRGQRGTEWATGLHQAGDAVVLLDQDALGFLSVNASSIGVERIYRGITVGDTLDSASDRAFTYEGVNLECLAPVHLGGYGNSSLDFVINWTRQSRFASWRDYVDTPLGEASEAYEVDIHSDGGYTTAVRTLTASSQTASYTAAQQLADFGSYQPIIYATVYQLSATMGRGYGGRVSLNSGSAWPATVALLVFEGADASTSIGDATGRHTWTARGNAQIDTAIVNLSPTALLLDGNGDYVDTPDDNDSNFGTGDFTIEGYIRIAGASAVADSGSGYRHMAILATNAATTGWDFYTVGDATNSNLGLGFESKLSGVASSISVTQTLTVGTWYHVAISRISGIARLFIGGTKVNEQAYAADIQGGSTGMSIGRQNLSGYYRYFNGSIDNRMLRITKGVGRYYADFTPPAAPFGEE